MKVVIFGGSGFIGSHLISYLTTEGHNVVLVSRSTRQMDNPLVHCVTWNELNDGAEQLEKTVAFVNLAGETINQRWTAKAKQKILQSRLTTTVNVAEKVRTLKHKPAVVINGSAVGIYGMSETATFDETSSQRGDDFLARVVRKWEKAADEIASHTRLVKLRTGVVLGKKGGAFPLMALPYKLYVGGRVGSGKQWLSWIHMTDMVRLIEFCIHNKNMHGPINATAPHPVTNDAFGRALARQINRPHYFPVPAFAFKLLLGEMSQLLLCGQRVYPSIAQEHGFQFTYPTLDKAMADIV